MDDGSGCWRLRGEVEHYFEVSRADILDLNSMIMSSFRREAAKPWTDTSDNASIVPRCYETLMGALRWTLECGDFDGVHFRYVAGGLVFAGLGRVASPE